MKSPLTAFLRFAKTGRLRWVVGSMVLVCVAIGGIAVQVWTPGETRAREAATSEPTESDEPIQPIEAVAGLDPRKIALGRKLFHDPRLSQDNQVSCSTCHDLKTGGTDRKARSIGIHGAVGVVNAPTVFNSGFNFSQFWDGRAHTLEEQIDGPVQSSLELGSKWPEVIDKLSRSREYVQAFRQTYRDVIRSDHVKDSIAEFERSLSTPNSRFDRYLRHNPQALTSREREGYNLFKSLGCASCHQG